MTDQTAASPDTANWQQRKSAQMREHVLATAIDVLVAHGYARFSVQALAKAAGISRGALAHHFPTKADLVSAVIAHTFNCRVARFLDDFRASGAIVDDQPRRATAMYWDSVQSREFAAYLELVVAARTDAELRGYFLTAAEQYDKVWAQEMVAAFPQWDGHAELLQSASDFVAAAHLGLLLQSALPAQRRARVLALIEQTVDQLYHNR